jgi:hypothetical protein
LTAFPQPNIENNTKTIETKNLKKIIRYKLMQPNDIIKKEVKTILRALYVLNPWKIILLQAVYRIIQQITLRERNTATLDSNRPVFGNTRITVTSEI